MPAWPEPMSAPMSTWRSGRRRTRRLLQRQRRGLRPGPARPPRAARGWGRKCPRAGPSRCLLAADRPRPRL
eukprot:8633092-Alexandrium_andersonii.AAC.1